MDLSKKSDFESVSMVRVYVFLGVQQDMIKVIHVASLQNAKGKWPDSPVIGVFSFRNEHVAVL